MMKTLLVCERSAGHVFPALAMANSMERSEDKTTKADIYFFITTSFLRDRIKQQGFGVVGLSLPFRNIIIEGICRPLEASYIILKLRPQKVIGFGGRDSFFLVLFSFFLRIKTAIYEPNVKMGKANKILSFFVNEVLRGFKDSDGDKKTKVIGIPLRENIRKMDKARARQVLNFDQRPVVLCLGGSQGSSFVNQAFLRFIKNYRDSLQIIHLTGKNEYFPIMQFYNKIGMNSFIKDFYYDMEVLYSAADLAVSRAGAATLGEISYYGLPSVLLPLAKAGGHQRENAFYLEKRGAAFVCLQDDFSFEKFSQVLESLIQDKNLRQSISNNLENIELGVGFEEFCQSSCF